MENVEIKELLEAGVHFGHQKKSWNPKMKPYIYMDKGGVCIINLEMTSEHLEKACQFLKECAVQKKNIVFVATKKHISDVVKEQAIRCGAFYIHRRWLGGLLTNFDTIRKRLNRLKELDDMQENGTVVHSNKKELSVFNKEYEKLEKTLGGIKTMRGKPDVLFVIDQKEEDIAIKEANLVGLKVVAVVDTNSDPDGIDYIIPANDDSIRSVKLITKIIADSIIEGYGGQVPDVHKLNSKGSSFKSQLRQPIKLVQEVTVPQEQVVS